MDRIKVKAHTCYLGKTGYNAHARGFFRELSKYVDLRVRNYTWDENPNYLDEVDLSILDTITLSTGEHSYRDFDISQQPIFSKYRFTTPKDHFHQDVDIVLMDMNHHYFYEKLPGKIKIAYTVWESTRLPEYFVNVLIENFDYVWVVTEWHRKVLSEQGYPESRIHVVNEAVDSPFFPNKFDNKFEDYQDGRFKFTIFGRWDFRKAVPEIVNAFLKEFKKEEPVDLILSADNPYAVDGMNSTEERLQRYDFVDPRIKVKHFVKRNDYIKYMQNGHVLVTCARSEGWNIPLIEAIACGTPALYSNYGAQLEFAQGTGIPVDVKGLIPCLSGDTYNVQALAGTEVPGYYAQPDYEDLQRKLRFAYENYEDLKKKALEDSVKIREKYNWTNAALQAMSFLNEKVNTSSVKEKKKEECAIVLSHADNRVKTYKLKDLVSKLQENGYTTIVSSHIPVEVDADYVLIEKNNPVITEEIAKEIGVSFPIFFVKSPTAEVHTPFKYNHGPAALSLIKNGLEFARGKGFKISHIINYDYYIKDISVLEDHNNELQKADLVSYEWGPKTEFYTGEISTGFFSAKTVILDDAIKDVTTIKDYLSHGNHLEHFMFNLLTKKNVNFSRIKGPDRDKVIMDTESTPAYPTIPLGKDFFDFSLTRESNTGLKILSLFRKYEFPVDVRLIRGNTFYQEYIDTQDVHLKISDDLLEEGFEIYLSSFEKKVKIDKNSPIGTSTIKDWQSVKELTKSSFISLSEKTRKINVNFIDGPFVEVTDSVKGRYFVEFIDNKTKEVVYSHEMSNNCWTKANRKWYTEWRIKVTDLTTEEVIYDKTPNFKNQRVFICMESSSLGDTLAWVPYADEFRKKHQCHVVLSTFHNDLFKDQYPQIEFVERGVSVQNIIACYRLGWFYENENLDFDPHKNPIDFRDQEMQKTASDILGLDYVQVRPKIYKPPTPRKIEGKYVCIGIHSTAQAKYWNHPDGWQKVIDYLKDKGYKVVLISKETGPYMGNKVPQGIIDKSGNYSLQERINDLQHAEFYIGLGSGLSWLAWATGTPIVLISGFSKPETEFLGDDIVRIFNPDKCNSCFNRARLDAGDWFWCPDHKNTSRQFECTKTITPEHVIEKMQKFIK